MKKIKIFLKNYKLPLSCLLIGLSIGALIMSLFIPERIAKLENGSEPIVSFNEEVITADEYYESLKGSISIELLLQEVDERILDNKYETTKEMEKEVLNKVNEAIKEYTDYYDCREEDFLINNNFRDKDEFYEIMLLEYKRNIYYEEYVKSIVKNEEINYYYIHNLNSDMEVRYIQGDETILTNVLDDLENGLSYDDIIKKYKNINYHDYSYVAFDNKEINIDMYTEALVLEENSFTESLVSINNQYYIIFKGQVKEKEDKDLLRDRIIEKVKDQKISNDSDNALYLEALFYLRKNANISFSDTILEKEYKSYTNQ